MGGEMRSWKTLYASGSARISSFLDRNVIAVALPVEIYPAGPMYRLPSRPQPVSAIRKNQFPIVSPCGETDRRKEKSLV
jgi:hypothetical protein